VSPLAPNSDVSIIRLLKHKDQMHEGKILLNKTAKAQAELPPHPAKKVPTEWVLCAKLNQPCLVFNKKAKTI